jgi:hypothetical protein
MSDPAPQGGGMEGQKTSQWSFRDLFRTEGRGRTFRGCIASLILGSSAFAGGCTALSNLQDNLSYNDSWSEWVIGQRNAAWSARAWHLRKHHFCNEKYLDDFCAGFRAGYIDVASGSNGCTPSFPPQEYWGWKYQSAEGQGRVAAWFAGFPHGARAAEEDGVGHFSQIQMSSTVYNEYNQAGFAGPSTQIYPMPENIPANMPGYVPPAAQGGIPEGAQPIADPAVNLPGAGVPVGIPQQ